ncbi:MAG: hypothetical protein GY815_14795 [Gammaproteobacteria bacterium]|nr:hypothetical protein [Gammaproteobacteria bacterium]
MGIVGAQLRPLGTETQRGSATDAATAPVIRTILPVNSDMFLPPAFLCFQKYSNSILRQGVFIGYSTNALRDAPWVNAHRIRANIAGKGFYGLLSKREFAVAEHYATGQSYKEVAR